MRAPALLSLVFAICFGIIMNSAPVQAREFSIGTQAEAKMVNAEVLESPTPEIPSEFQREAFKSTLTARFAIATDAKFTVKLMDSSGNEEIDRIVVDTLKKWKFKPASLDGHPIASNRKLRIEIEVE